MSNSKKDRTSNSNADNSKEIEDSRIIVYGICVTILLAGIFIGYTLSNSSDLSLSRIFPIVASVIIGLVITGLSPYFMKRFVEKYISSIEKVHEKEKAEIEKNHEIEKNNIEKRHEIERNSWKMGLNNAYRENQDLEFLSIVYESNQSFPSNLEFGTFCSLINKLRSKTNALEKAAKNYASEFDIRQKALEGLAKGFTREDNKNVSRFAELIVESCNYALDNNVTKPLDIRINYKWARPFYKNIRLYLKAWLVCSMRHGVAIGIMPFFQEPLEDEGKDRYHGIETCIVAIKHIQLLFDHEKMIEIIDLQESRDIIKLYLEELIKMLESNNTSEITAREWGYLMTNLSRL